MMGRDYVFERHTRRILATNGKTAAVRRVLPMTPRVRMILKTRWDDARGS
jgi:hypothetical protein